MDRRAFLTLCGLLAAAFAGVERLAAVQVAGGSPAIASQAALRLRSPLDLARGDPEPVEGSGQAPRLRSGQAEEEVRQAESDRFAAMLKGDVAALEQLLAAELSYTHGDGRVVDRPAFIADLKTGDFKYLSIQPTGVKVRVFGDTAIVTGAAGMHVVSKGSPVQIRIVYTNTHIKRNGSWQMVAWHATRVAQ